MGATASNIHPEKSEPAGSMRETICQQEKTAHVSHEMQGKHTIFLPDVQAVQGRQGENVTCWLPACAGIPTKIRQSPLQIG